MIAPPGGYAQTSSLDALRRLGGAVEIDVVRDVAACLSLAQRTSLDLIKPPPREVPQHAAESPPHWREYLRGLRRYTMRIFVVVHLFAGAEREEDLGG